MKNNNKFYQLKQSNSSLGYVKTRSDAEKYARLFNTKVHVYPIKITEHVFKTKKEINEELEDV